MLEKELASSYLQKACEINILQLQNSNIVQLSLNLWHLCVIVLEGFSWLQKVPF